MRFFHRKKKNPEKKLPTNSMIRILMQRTGWDSYQAYSNFVRISKEYNATYKEVLSKKLWKDYKYQEALQQISDTPIKTKNYEVELLTKEQFEKVFYTSKQLEGMNGIKNGDLSLENICKFLKINPKKLNGIDVNDYPKMQGKVVYRTAAVNPGDLLFCLSKKNASVEAITRRKPMLVLTSPIYAKELKDLKGIQVVECKYLRSRAMELSAMWRSSLTAKTVAISGSIGKTTTTEMIGNVLGSATNMYKITGNRNTTDQVAQFVYNLKKNTETFVQECSGSYLGQLENSSKVLAPNYYVITNIGQGHIGNYDGKPELLLYEKTALDRNAAPDGVGIINWDDAMLKKVHYRHNIIKCAIYDKEADIVADNIIEKDGTVIFDAIENNAGGIRTTITLNIAGIHNIYNAMSAFAVGVGIGIPRETIVKALADYKPHSVRQNMVWLGGQRVYIDCYSATVESMETAMRVLPSISVPEGKKKIAIIADIPALGKDSEEKHRDVGKMVAEVNSADEVIFYGHEMKYAMEEAEKYGFHGKSIETQEALEEWMKGEFPNAGIFVLKASHKMKLQWVLDDLFGTSFYCYDELTAHAPIHTIDYIDYKCMENYGCMAARVDKTADEIILLDEVEQMDVRAVGRNVCMNAKLSKIKLPARLRSISSNAFLNCINLESIKLPETLQYIGENAFESCKRLTEIEIPENCTTIDNGAFKDCSSLCKVTLPASLKTIAETAFENDENIQFVCPANSYAETWASDHGYSITTI